MSGFELLLLAIAASLPVLAWRLVRPGSGVVIGDRGILVRRLRVGWIPWEQIEGAYRSREPGDHGETLWLRVRTTERLWSRLRRRDHLAPGRQPPPTLIEVPLELSGTDFSEVEVLQQILAHRSEDPPVPSPPLPGQENGVPCR